MVKFAKTIVPSLYKPVLFFGDMIINTRESFKKDVNQQDLFELVSQVIQRSKDGEYGFEHLSLSNSRVHKNYRPFTEKTIFLLQRILSDLTSMDNTSDRLVIGEPEMKVINKIFTNKQLTEYLFRNSKEVDQTLAIILDSLQS